MRYNQFITYLHLTFLFIPGLSYSQAQSGAGESESALSADDTEADVVSFTADYFEKFKPLTALEMVQQVPGFQLDVSEVGIRGLANAAGNLLINDQRPSAKQELASAILSRIPAGNVERIELIRRQVRGIDLRGQSSLINIILREDTPAAVKWEAAMLKPFKHGPFTPSLSASLTDKWKDIVYNTGFSVFKNSYGRSGLDELFDGIGNRTENRFDERENRVRSLKGNFNAASTLEGGTLVKLNTVLAHEKRTQFLVSDRVPQAAGSNPRVEEFEENFDKPIVEIGLDAERGLNSDLTGKAILLFYRADDASYKSQRVVDAQGKQTSFRLAEGNAISTELISRLEFDWTGMQNHTLQANLERAYNSLDGSLDSTLDTGSGPATVAVPGANSFVKEVRWDLLLQDTWSREQLELDFGLGAEVSTISQTGDAEQERDFFFLKPHGVLTYSQESGKQTRLRVAREVSQLVLTEFVTSSLLEDDDLALGNPDIQPEITWVTELSHERRFDSNSVIRLRAFHHWISNVLDLLPVTPTFETPGNIGNGRRWGVELEATVPLAWLGLTGARLDIKTRWQDSTVVDPVTGENRVLSGPTGDFPILYEVENKYGISLDYRQDFEASRVAWGWTMIERAERSLFKVNELEVNDDKIDLNMFVETTRWLGIKVRLSAMNVLNSPGTRDRTVFTGERDLSPVRFQELRSRDRDRSMTLTLSGVF